MVKQNTGSCGMNNNQYLKSLREDYPTLAQVNEILIRYIVII